VGADSRSEPKTWFSTPSNTRRAFDAADGKALVTKAWTPRSTLRGRHQWPGQLRPDLRRGTFKGMKAPGRSARAAPNIGFSRDGTRPSLRCAVRTDVVVIDIETRWCGGPDRAGTGLRADRSLIVAKRRRMRRRSPFVSERPCGQPKRTVECDGVETMSEQQSSPMTRRLQQTLRTFRQKQRLTDGKDQ